MWQTTNLKRQTCEHDVGEIELTQLNNYGELTTTRIVIPTMLPAGDIPGAISNIELSAALFDLSYGLEPGIVDEYLENDKYDPNGPGPSKMDNEIPSKPIKKAR